MATSTRKDAAANRRHLVTVARDAFAADGLDVPVREIARRAGLGIATVYRHFPARTDLLHAVLAAQVAACEAEMADALADPDAWHALSGIVHRFAQRQVTDRGLNEALYGPADAFAAQRRAHVAGVGVLVTRARDAGQLREGVTADDVRIGLRAIAALRVSPADSLPAAISRLTGVLLAGLAAR